MAAALKKAANNSNSSLKRKNPSSSSSSTPKSSKKAKSGASESSRIDSESVTDAPSFNANVVPAGYKAKPHEVLKTFDESVDSQSLVAQAEGFYKKGSQICIENGADWEGMTRYKAAVYMQTNFRVGDDVLVMQDETNDERSDLPTDLKGRWVGRILEIRALDHTNVFVLVNWYNRPEDLPKGRQPHHGMSEILATNDVDIISPTTLVGKIEIDHWIESDDTAPPDRTVFWRQCVAMEEKGKLKFSKLKSVCTCDQPANVDKALIGCETCNLWMHDECLIKDLVKREGVPEKKWSRLVEADAEGDLPDVLPKKFKLSPPKGKPWTVEMDTEKGMFVSEDKGGEQWEGKMECLQCHAWLK